MDVLRDGELWLHGTVGNGFFSAGFTASDVAEALSVVGNRRPVTIHLNSGGGVASEGAAIYSVLKQHAGPKTILIEGVAASAASALAMAGDTVVMLKGSIMMIHDPSGITAGTSADHQKSIEMLEALANSMADIYAAKSGKTREEARADMEEEVWLTPEAAKAAGYVDRIDNKSRSKPIAAFDYRLYENAPDRLVALAKSNGWEADAEQADDGAAEQEENEMAENAKGGTTTKSVATDTPEFKAAVAEAVTATMKANEETAKVEAAKKIAADAAAQGKETVEQITARIRSEEQKRLADITATCALAGHPTKAAEFIASGKTLSEVVAALQDERVKGTGGKSTASGDGKELNTHRQGGKAEARDVDGPAAWKRQTDKINARNSRHLS